MNPKSFKEAKKLFLDIKETASRGQKTQTVICPPSVFISELGKLYSGHRIAFGAQNIFWENNGAYTGELSSEMVKSAGARYVIIGHSERRELGETNKDVNKKIISALKSGLYAILCVGERNRDSQALYLQFLKEELESALFGVSKNNLKNLIVAYEPIWAIGKTKDNAISPYQMHQMYIFIRKTIMELYGKNIAINLPIIYGGSIESGNTRGLLAQGEIDGFLVGHTSLVASEFNKILKITNSFKSDI